MRRPLAATLLVLSCSKGPATPAPTSPAVAAPATTVQPQPPPTEIHEVVDRYHGVEVVDPYQWLENAGDPNVQAWSDAQNEWARAHLDALTVAAELRPQAEAILAAPTVSFSQLAIGGDVFFAFKRQPPKPQPVIVAIGAAGVRTVVDPSVLDSKGSTHIDWFRPSPDGALLAVSLSVGGSESGDVHIFDSVTGKEVHEVVPRVNGGTAGGDLVWAKNGKGFFYTRYPAEGERPEADLAFFQQLYFHRLGAKPNEDRYELGEGLPRVAEIQLDRAPGGETILATVQKGDGGEFAHFIRSRGGKWTQFSDFGDRTVQASFGAKGGLYIVSRKGAPRGRLLLTSTKLPNVATAREIIPEGKDTLVTDFWGGRTVVATDSKIYVRYQTGGPSEIRAFDHRGKPVAGPEQPPVSAVSEMLPTGGDGLTFSVSSYVAPKQWSRWDGSKSEPIPELNGEPAADFSKVEVVREFATSKDGTKVPVSILMPKGAKLDGSNPGLVTGYGGFGVSLQPRQRASYALLLDRGFVIAVANLRGGAEFGDPWHEAGRLTKKQNVFDDFAAVLEHLIARGYTKSERLAIEGGSNGGLLMGALLVQRPELVKAVVSHVGIYDMLRVELSSNGAFNITEFGTVQNKAEFAALHAYSPYHHVQDGRPYPAVLFMTGANDPRVDPMQSRKMTARLQAASRGGPVLLRTSSNTGHGSGTPLAARVEQTVDAYAFLLTELGVAP